MTHVGGSFDLHLPKRQNLAAGSPGITLHPGQASRYSRKGRKVPNAESSGSSGWDVRKKDDQFAATVSPLCLSFAASIAQ